MKDRYICNYLGIDSLSFQNTRRVDFETWQNPRLEHILILFSSPDLSKSLGQATNKDPILHEKEYKK